MNINTTRPQVTRAQALILTAATFGVAMGTSSPAYAVPSVVGGIRALWINNPGLYGQPLEAEQALSPVSAYQAFTRGVIIWDYASGAHFYPNSEGTYQRTGPGNMLRDTSKVLGPQDAIVIGDSQVGEPNQARNYWVGKGIMQAGYTPYFYSWGGVGIITANQWHPSYYDSVVNNARALPLGSPGLIYINASGNDLWTNKPLNEVTEAARLLIRKLKELYPGSRIVLSEILSRRIAEHANRHYLSGLLRDVARQEGIDTAPTRYWVTDKNVAHLLADSVHLSPTGHDALAPYLAAWLRWLNGTGFADILPSNQFFTQINWMRANGLSTGWDDGTYRPWDTMRRDAMAAFFYRLAGSPRFDPPATSTFRDVTTGDPFYKEITWMYANGISTGWDDGTYRPWDTVRRDAMAAFIYRFSGSPAFIPPTVSPFKDIATGNPFYREIAWMYASGISTGWVDGTYRPLQASKRDAMAAFIYRYKTGKG
ncbi:S-layer homology domain-containing protein [Rothia sp. P5764]|uniref:S-layer homology domain-containing protein n=1 Tax=Rothia sp. P5764 TaxID=3402654 RepID=UPI003AD55E5E